MTAPVSLAAHRRRLAARRLHFGWLKEVATMVNGKPWPCGYSVRKSPVSNCIYCPDCGTAVAEAWKGKSGRWLFCTRRGDECGAKMGREAALVAAVNALADEGWDCTCEAVA